MKRSIEWMKAHPLVLFFALTLGFMYILFIIAIILNKFADQTLLQLLIQYTTQLAVYGPVLAGMLVTRWTLPNHSPVSAKNRWLTFGFIWLITRVVYALNFQRSLSNN